MAKNVPIPIKRSEKPEKSVAFATRFPIYCWHNCITALRKIHQYIMQISQNARNKQKTCKKSVDKSPRRQYNNTCKQRSYTNTKSSCGSFCFKRDCKSSAVSAKAQRGADRIFSDPFQEKSGTAAVRKLPIERGGYQWISYPR